MALRDIHIYFGRMPLHAMTKAAVVLPSQLFEKGLRPPIVQHRTAPHGSAGDPFLGWPKPPSGASWALLVRSWASLHRNGAEFCRPAPWPQCHSFLFEVPSRRSPWSGSNGGPF